MPCGCGGGQTAPLVGTRATRDQIAATAVRSTTVVWRLDYPDGTSEDFDRALDARRAARERGGKLFRVTR